VSSACSGSSRPSRSTYAGAVTEQEERDQRAEEEGDYGAMQELREALGRPVGELV
jgi:hypothetical protein